MCPMNPRLLRPTARGFLLDTVGAGAYAAYSVRRLSSSYTGAAVRVRRSNDNAEADFSPEEIGSIAAWVGAGNNGFVRTWYDQTGNARHAEQSTSGAQPRLVGSGTLETSGPRPVLRFFNSRGDVLSMPLTGHAVLDVYGMWLIEDAVYAVFHNVAIGSRFFFCASNSPGALPHASVGVGSPAYYANGSLLVSPDRIAIRDAFLNVRRTFAVLNTRTDDAQWGATARFGSYQPGGSDFAFEARVSEVILYTASTSSRRERIEQNLNAYYAVY